MGDDGDPDFLNHVIEIIPGDVELRSDSSHDPIVEGIELIPTVGQKGIR
jgi:hypothetical protein